MGGYSSCGYVAEPIRSDRIEQCENIRSLQQQALESLHRSLITQMEKVFLEGLSRKGFTLQDRSSIEQFIKNNCTCEDYQHAQHKVYKVNGIPFLVHYYGTEITTSHKDREVIMTASMGGYKYL